MPLTLSSNRAPISDELPAVDGQLTYLAPGDDHPKVRVYPPASGLATVRPASVRHLVSIRERL